MIKFVAKCALFLTGFLVIVELFFRFVIPAAEVPAQKYDEENGILHLDASMEREGVYTIGKLGTIGGLWRINDQGWNDPNDFKTADEREKPLIAVIGASHIEGLFVNQPDNLGSQLSDLLKDEYAVYNFAKWGAPFSEMIQIMRYVRKEYKPDIVLVRVSKFAIKYSVAQMDKMRDRHQISFEKGSFVEKPMALYKPSTLRRFFRISAFCRYLYFNRRIKVFLRNWRPNRTTAGFSSSQASSTKKKVDLAPPAAEFLLELLMKTNPDIPVVLFAVGPYQKLYSKGNEDIKLHKHCILLKNECSKYKNCHFFDLTPTFVKDFEENNIRFSYEHDRHWNAHGHKVAAEALYDFLKSKIIAP